jgi:nucleotide-binding universal stress UspA family protein
MTAFGKQGLTIALLIALAYVIQIQSAAWYVRLVDLIFGKAEARVSESGEVKADASPATGKAAAADGGAAPQPSPPMAAPPAVPTIQRILLATDLSPSARYAALHACSLGNQYQARVTLMHVIPDAVDLLSSEAGVDLADFIDDNQWHVFHEKSIDEARRRMVRRIKEISGKVAQQIPDCALSEDNIRVGIGDPAKEIVAAAQRGHYDLIIMGSHGHGKLEETMIGSVTHAVIHQSRIPVLVVRLPADHIFAVPTVGQPSALPGTSPQ